MESNSAKLKPFMVEGKQVKLRDTRPKDQIKESVCSCFISHEGILVSTELWDDWEKFDPPEMPMVTLIDLATGKHKGNALLQIVMVARLAIWLY